MATIVRDVTPADLPAALAINNAAVPNVNALDRAALTRFLESAAYFRVATRHGEVAALLIALGPQYAYDSPNFRWFCDHYRRFIYIDRVVVDGRFRGLGIGNVLYADVQSYAEQRAPRLTCEVNLEPRNDVSLLFHGTHGFSEVGQQVTADGRRVSLLAKPLPSFEFVRRRYGDSLLEAVGGSR